MRYKGIGQSKEEDYLTYMSSSNLETSMKCLGKEMNDSGESFSD